ncbi:MAG: adenylate/guanylate cyclase domain-containing protein, partial [Opitutales bacterium]
GTQRSGGSDTWLEGEAEGDGGDYSGGQEGIGGGKKKKTTTLTSIIVKLLMVVLFSVTIASGAAMMVDGVMGGTRLFGVHFVGNAQSNLLIGAFTITFLICAAGLAVKVMHGSKLEDPNQRRAVARQAKLIKKAQQEKAKQKTKKKATKPKVPESPQDEIKAKAKEENKKTQENLDEAMKGVDDFVVEHVTEPKPEDPETKAVENEATTDRLQAELNKDKPPEDETTQRGVVLDADFVDKPAAPPADGMSPQEEKQKTYMLKFLSGALEGDQTDLAKMDNFNKFGVNLYLAGACEIMSQKNDLDVNARSKILADSVQVMGFKKSHAASFADKYEGYLMADSRYMQMFQAGRNDMNIYSTDENSAPRHLDNAMTEWNKPKPKEEQTGPVTVLFTDIAGSTAMTQALGDAGAQKVVRIHNRIVREALSAHAGKEIKHTGDGIMASFAKTSDAVNGSIQMQLETMKHNQVEPDLLSAFKNRAEFRGTHCRGQRPVRDRGAVVGAYYR